MPGIALTPGRRVPVLRAVGVRRLVGRAVPRRATPVASPPCSTYSILIVCLPSPSSTIVAELGVRRALPLVDHPPAVDVEPDTVVGEGRELVAAGAEPLRLGPADGEAVGGQRRVGRAVAPGEVDRRVLPRQDRACPRRSCCRSTCAVNGCERPVGRRVGGVVLRRRDDVADALAVRPAGELQRGAVRRRRRSLGATSSRWKPSTPVKVRGVLTGTPSSEQPEAGRRRGQARARDFRGRTFTILLRGQAVAVGRGHLDLVRRVRRRLAGGRDRERSGAAGQRADERVEVRAVVQPDLGLDVAVVEVEAGRVAGERVVGDRVARPVQLALASARRR